MDNTYSDNIAKFTAEELARYEGQYVAFSSDGSKILASATSILGLASKLDDLGFIPAEYEIEPITPSDIGLIL
jgi:hypothetical protein